MNKKDFERYIKEFDFRGLFIDMGWHKDDISESITIENEVYTLQSIAEQSGFRIFVATASSGLLPLYKTRRLIENKISRIYHDHLIIFIDNKKTEQLWLLVTRLLNQRVQVSEVSWKSGKSVELLYQRTAGLVFEMEDEDTITIIDVTKRVSSFNQNNEAVTKKFYERFRKEHDTFTEFITGIDLKLDKDWYASLMLNRLMFCYFIQKRYFLDNDIDYLANKLKSCRKAHGKDTFYSFYRNFLKLLFHQGFASPKHDEALVKEIGHIPYLNGGLFDLHELETKHSGIDIKDDAFEKIFAFFDAYQWTLDTRADAKGDEINPDVIGYIFEKYINDRAQMGAYYTKEDITEYISKNCIIPHLFDAIENKYPHPFVKNGDVWLMVQERGDSYIYDAVKKGIDKKLPDEIEKGIKNVAERGGWNKPALTEYALPTEIWRETVARRQRCADIQQKINTGDVKHINDFITYNLNIRQFAQDVIEQTDDAALVKAYWYALKTITILDPTCGSGAFLFAALNVLEPLYNSCITRMSGFVEDEDRANSRKNGNFRNELKEFREVLADIQNPKHPNQSYYIYKTIILNNLYGVDIMREAAEIAKLRLFLKLVSTVEADYRKPNLGLEPLPDIDFNIRSGNTLVGFAAQKEIEDAFKGEIFDSPERLKTILDSCATLASEFKHFQEVQLIEGADGYSCKKVKTVTQKHLDDLRAELNGYMALVYGINPQIEKARYTEWLTTHQPFHWFAEFYQIIALNGGFDVVIGNPPYLELRQIDYIVKGLKTMESATVHAMCIERSFTLINKMGNVSMIVPLALVCTQRMIPVQKIIEDNRAVWYSNFAWRPAKLFDTVNRALTIFIANNSQEQICNNTGYMKWNSDNRNNIFEALSFIDYSEERNSFWSPKLSHKCEKEILGKVLKQEKSITDYSVISNDKIYYRTTGGLYWKVFTDKPPKFIENGKAGSSSRETSISLNDKTYPRIFVALFSSSLFWWWYTVTSNLRDLNPSDLTGFKFSEGILKSKSIFDLADKYIESLNKNSTMLTRIQKNKGETVTQSFKISLSKPIIDEIDRVLANYYGFTDEERDFIINYDIKYRMGGELEGEE